MHNDRNNHSAAARSLALAVEVAEKNPAQVGRGYLLDAYRRLGESYSASGKNGDAKAAFGKYLELADPDDSGRAEVQRLMRDL